MVRLLARSAAGLLVALSACGLFWLLLPGHPGRFRHRSATGPGMEWVSRDSRDLHTSTKGKNLSRHRSACFPVVSDAEPEAVAALGARSAVRLTADEFRRFAGREPDPTLLPYLVRAVRYAGTSREEAAEHFVGLAWYGHRHLWCGVWSGDGGRLEKQPIVVQVKEELDEVVIYEVFGA